MNLFGTKLEAVFLVKGEEVLAYAWHYSKDKALQHLQKIREYHNLRGEVVYSRELEGWLEEEVERVVVNGEKFSLPEFEYKNREVYEVIVQIPRGKTARYSEIARLSGVKFTQLLVALMRNPLQVLIPCHRLVTKDGTLMGFYPLGVEVKRKLLEIEDVKWQEKSE